MDVFVRNVPMQATQKELDKIFKEPLSQCGIRNYHCETMKGKPFAIITILDALKAQQFLNLYGLPMGRGQAVRPLLWHGRTIQCLKGNRDPSIFLVKSLADEAARQAVKPTATALTQGQSKGSNASTTRFAIGELHSGTWFYKGNALTFSSHFAEVRKGTVSFGGHEAVLLLGSKREDQTRIDISYAQCESVVLGDYSEPCITLTLRFPPKFYHIDGVDVLTQQVNLLVLGPTAARERPVKKTRSMGIDAYHAKLAGFCYVYRIRLMDFKDVSRVRDLLRRHGKMPPTTSMHTSIHNAPEDIHQSFLRLSKALADGVGHGGLPFTVLYQLERLARNATLHPSVVLQLLPAVSNMQHSLGVEAICFALRRLSSQMPIPGPDMQAKEFTLQAIVSSLQDFAAEYDRYSADNPYELVKRHQHVTLTHRIVITPTTIALKGPDPEPTNRVLRRYGEHPDHFVRVIFQDEDGSSVRYDPRTSNHLIFRQRFLDVINGTISIAGQGYRFLGFSHSSLRTRACWFMSPLFRGSDLALPQHILKELGDFEHIRIPAKCAARIGQNFTDTVASINVPLGAAHKMANIERNGRDFSDGCGTISLQLLQRVWRVYGSRRLLKPTALQIRYAGSKGMVALDTQLTGNALMLRPSMEKFTTSANINNLEICGAAFKALPMFLNRPLIKLLEDLGVHYEAFKVLQEIAVAQLRCLTTSTINTVTFLQRSQCPRATRLPNLLQLLHHIGLDYHQDEFLFSVVRTVVVSELREIKYRGRIPVPQGYTLYGIVDETGILREGEVYVAVEDGPKGGREVLIKNAIAITRSPAMHPGDVQLVNAVEVPSTSPLQSLSNVVVFSQHGDRDLPSKLSGGDLDGDLYNIIWDRTLIPKWTHPAADYPRANAVELDRPVNQQDMADFFVTFMETDQLGVISSRHLQLADQKPMGVCDQDCITLAGMASVAVDYSKTGIPVDMNKSPKWDKRKPDFMAPNPRVVIDDRGMMDVEDVEEQDDEALEDLDAERSPVRYYPSEKALGHLYRAIDERQFIDEMQEQYLKSVNQAQNSSASLLQRVQSYLLHWASQYGVAYKHHLELARDIRASYEDRLLDLLYNYSPTTNMPVSEQEAFAGTILGRQGGAIGRPLREASKELRNNFEPICDYAALRIVKGDEVIHSTSDLEELLGDAAPLDDREAEALPRALACLQVALTEHGLHDRRLGELKSFRYLAAGVALREFERFRITTFGSRTLPSV